MSVFQGIEYYISKRMGRAIIDYQMIQDGDKIVVGVSGGKDSLTMLTLLEARKRFVPIDYTLVPVHVDSGYPKSCAKPLVRYLKRQGVTCHVETIDLKEQSNGKKINCFWCAWNRRKALFTVADRLGCTKVAFGHHKDDIVQTILLNMFFHGETSSMVPKQELFGGKITIIRPLAYVEERMIKRYMKQVDFPVYQCECPNSMTSNRLRVARIINGMEKVCPEIKTNIFKSIKRIKEGYLL